MAEATLEAPSKNREKRHSELDYGAHAPNLAPDSPMSVFFAKDKDGNLKSPETLARCAQKVRLLRGLEKRD